MDHGPEFSMQPLAGGWSGETFLSTGVGEPTVVRIYGGRSASRGPEGPEVDAAVMRLVRGLVPVPDVLEVRRANPVADAPGLLVASYVEGERADLVVPRLDEEGLARVGSQVGRIVGTLAGMPTTVAGIFTSADLGVQPWAPTADGLPGWVAAAEERLTGWSEDELAGLRSVAGTAQERLDSVERTCLVHSDLHPHNLLLDPESLEVTALVDWEFAHSGHPFADLGSAIRSVRSAAWVDSVVGEYVGLRGGSAAEAADLARSADLWSLVDLATRAGHDPIADEADALLRSVAARRDVHAAAH